MSTVSHFQVEFLFVNSRFSALHVLVIMALDLTANLLLIAETDFALVADTTANMNEQISLF